MINKLIFSFHILLVCTDNGICRDQDKLPPGQSAYPLTKGAYYFHLLVRDRTTQASPDQYPIVILANLYFLQQLLDTRFFKGPHPYWTLTPLLHVLSFVSWRDSGTTFWNIRISVSGVLGFGQRYSWKDILATVVFGKEGYYCQCCCLGMDAFRVSLLREVQCAAVWVVLDDVDERMLCGDCAGCIFQCGLCHWCRWVYHLKLKILAIYLAHYDLQRFFSKQKLFWVTLTKRF